MAKKKTAAVDSADSLPATEGADTVIDGAAGDSVAEGSASDSVGSGSDSVGTDSLPATEGADKSLSLVRVLCTRVNASTEICGVIFEPSPKGMLSVPISADVAAQFNGISGYTTIAVE